MDKLIPAHQVRKYINAKLIEKDWMAKNLAKVSGLGETEISNLRSGKTRKLKAEVFYRLYTSFGEKCEDAIKIVYPGLNLAMGSADQVETRTKFGQYMRKHETVINSMKEISLKTGIPTTRLHSLYYVEGAIEAYELILVELAVNAKMGSMFKELYKFKLGKL